MGPAAQALGLQVQFYEASTSGEIDAAFAASLSGRFMRKVPRLFGGCLSGSNRPPRWPIEKMLGEPISLRETARL
jgi:hypothetical protein